MENTPFHYDGRSPFNKEEVPNEAFMLTDEARMNIAANPYLSDGKAEQE